MDKFNTKFIGAFLLLTIGLIICLSTFFVNHTRSSDFITWIFIGGAITLLGLSIAFSLSREYTLIMRLKSGKIPLLAKWSYKPHHYPLLKQEMNQNRQVMTIFILLIGVFSLLMTIVMGLGNSPLTLTTATPIGIAILIICIVWFMSIQTGYYKVLTSRCETLISDRYFLYNDELYSFQKGAYDLLSIDIVTKKKSYIQLEYGLPGTSYTSLFHVLIPVPDEELDTAHLIVSLYTESIYTESINKLT